MRIAKITAYEANIIRQIRRAFDAKAIVTALDYIKRYNCTVNKTKGLEEILSKNKSNIIRFMLTQYQTFLTYEYPYDRLMLLVLEERITELIATGIAWHELELINQSVNVQLKKFTSS